MSFFGKVVNLGKKAYNFYKKSKTAQAIVQTVVAGYTLNKLSKSINKTNDSPSGSGKDGSGLPTIPYVDPGVREQVDASTNNRIPIVYGQAQLGGIVVDAAMSNNNQTMTYVMAISEVTGTLLSDDSDSVFTFKNIYWDDQRIVFKTTGTLAGISADYSVDRDGNRDYSIADRVEVYCYAGSGASADRLTPENYTNTTSYNAWDIMPIWTSSHQMNDIVFAVVKINYDREKGITGLPEMRFHIQNSMKLPGDVMNDYMKSTRYGVGLTASQIYDE